MGEKEQPSEYSSSQESLPLSQGTFQFLFEQIQGNRTQQNQTLDNTYFVVNNVDYNGAAALCSLDSSSSSVPEAQQPQVTVPHVPSSVPAVQSWPGEFEFAVSFPKQEKSTKGVAWTYSELKDKLYVGKDQLCPINFSTNRIMEGDVKIRCMALFSSSKDLTDVVHRCVNHSMEELNQGVPEAEHLVRCEASSAAYETDSSGRHSVIVPFENSHAGQNFSTYIYKFVCFGSCAGGPNRRPLMLIFTLEKEREVVGRRNLPVKICACPGRDRKSEELPFCDKIENPIPLKRKETFGLTSLGDVFRFTDDVLLPPPKKAKTVPTKDGYYIITVQEPQCYEFLKQMQKLYEICTQMQKRPILYCGQTQKNKRKEMD